MENHSLLLHMPSEVKNSMPKDSIRSPALTQSENQTQLQKIEVPLRRSDVLGMSHKEKPLLLCSQYWRQCPALLGAHLPCGPTLQGDGHPLLPENCESTLPGLCNYIKTSETALGSSRHHVQSRLTSMLVQRSLKFTKKYLRRHFKACLNETNDRSVFAI